jgi:hypothetical protein
MKSPHGLALSLLLPFTALQVQATTSGFVFCDSNQNGQFDNGDTPVPGVLVVVTNTSGTFSNANWTGTPDGGFVIPLGSLTDTYVEYIEPATLPPDAVIVQPSGGVYTFTLSDDNTPFSGNFLFSSSTCTNGAAPPPPPPPTNTMSCCLHASGSICGPGHKSAFTFSGTALPSCDSTNGDTGEWEITASSHKLRFEGSVFEIVNCGEDADAAGNNFNFIEFQGAGTLKGFGGCKANYGVVYFFAHAEDHGHFCKAPDSLYFHVYAADGTSLLLIGGDVSDPTNVVPVRLSAGHLVIGTNCCETATGCDHGERGEGEDPGKGNGHCDQPPGKHGDDHGAGDDKGNHCNGNGKGGDDNGAGDDKSGNNGHGNDKCNNNATSHGNGNQGTGHGESGHTNGKGNGGSCNNQGQSSNSSKSNPSHAGSSSKNNHGHGG